MPDQPEMLAIVVMLEPSSGRMILQWPPQLTRESTVTVLMQAVQALMPPQSPIALPTDGDVRNLTKGHQ